VTCRKTEKSQYGSSSSRCRKIPSKMSTEPGAARRGATWIAASVRWSKATGR
jgi:hypothetical protein